MILYYSLAVLFKERASYSNRGVTYFDRKSMLIELSILWLKQFWKHNFEDDMVNTAQKHYMLFSKCSFNAYNICVTVDEMCTVPFYSLKNKQRP